MWSPDGHAERFINAIMLSLFLEFKRDLGGVWRLTRILCTTSVERVNADEEEWVRDLGKSQYLEGDRLGGESHQTCKLKSF